MGIAQLDDQTAHYAVRVCSLRGRFVPTPDRSEATNLLTVSTPETTLCLLRALYVEVDTFVRRKLCLGLGTVDCLSKYVSKSQSGSVRGLVMCERQVLVSQESTSSLLCTQPE